MILDYVMHGRSILSYERAL